MEREMQLKGTEPFVCCLTLHLSGASQEALSKTMSFPVHCVLPVALLCLCMEEYKLLFCILI